MAKHDEVVHDEHHEHKDEKKPAGKKEAAQNVEHDTGQPPVSKGHAPMKFEEINTEKVGVIVENKETPQPPLGVKDDTPVGVVPPVPNPGAPTVNQEAAIEHDPQTVPQRRR